MVRVAGHVLRPSTPQTPLIHALFRHVRAAGFAGVPEPVGVDADGRERLVFIEGDVPVPPFPAWSQADDVLASTAALLRGFHDAAASFVTPEGMTWSDEMTDPLFWSTPQAPSPPGSSGEASRSPHTGADGNPIVCHNDVCPENVVYRDGVAVALLDFDFAAPGRPLYDLAQLAKMCVPIDTPEDAARLGRGSLDPFSRLRVVADAYGLPAGREEFVDVLWEGIDAGARFVLRHVERGEPAFVEMWNTMGGQERYDRRRAWFDEHRARFVDALG